MKLKIRDMAKAFGISRACRNEKAAETIFSIILEWREMHEGLCKQAETANSEVGDEEMVAVVSDSIGTSSMVTELLHSFAIGAISRNDLLLVIGTLRASYENIASLSEAQVKLDSEMDEEQAVHLKMCFSRFTSRSHILAAAEGMIGNAELANEREAPLPKQIRTALSVKAKDDSIMGLAGGGDQWFSYHVDHYGMLHDFPSTPKKGRKRDG